MNESKKLLVSVILPHHNRADFLKKALGSVQSQIGLDPGEIEIIVVDDASSAWTEAFQVIGSFSQESQFPVHLARHFENFGPGAARNTGAALASGDYLAFLDSDDQWEPKKLISQIAYHSQVDRELGLRPRISQTDELWYRNGRRVNRGKRHSLPKGEFFFRSLELCLLSPSAVFLERELYFSVDGFDERLRLCEDYDLWLRLALREKVGLVEQSLVKKFAGHSDQLSVSEPALDRYRVFSLAKIFSEESLSSEQREALSEMLKAKLEILVQGSSRREQQEKLEIYEALLVSLSSGDLAFNEVEYITQVIPQEHSRQESLGVLSESNSFELIELQ